jgi:hypothetical protein
MEGGEELEGRKEASAHGEKELDPKDASPL